MPINFVEPNTDYMSYLPSFYAEIPEFQEIAKTVNEELNLLKKEINFVLSEQFIQSAEKTIRWREEEYGIVANSNESLDFRRQRLIERKSRTPRITLRSLRERLNTYIGSTQASAEVIPGEYAFVVQLPAVDGFKYKDIQQLIDRLKPANMEYVQKPISLESVRIVETSTEIKISYARVGLSIAGKTRVGTMLNSKVVYSR